MNPRDALAPCDPARDLLERAVGVGVESVDVLPASELRAFGLRAEGASDVASRGTSNRASTRLSRVGGAVLMEVPPTIC